MRDDIVVITGGLRRRAPEGMSPRARHIYGTSARRPRGSPARRKASGTGWPRRCSPETAGRRAAVLHDPDIAAMLMVPARVSNQIGHGPHSRVHRAEQRHGRAAGCAARCVTSVGTDIDALYRKRHGRRPGGDLHSVPSRRADRPARPGPVRRSRRATPRCANARRARRRPNPLLAEHRRGMDHRVGEAGLCGRVALGAARSGTASTRVGAVLPPLDAVAAVVGDDDALEQPAFTRRCCG